MDFAANGQVLQGDLLLIAILLCHQHDWLKSASMECRGVYCDMDTIHYNIRGGCSCPTSLQKINTPAKLCMLMTHESRIFGCYIPC